MPPRRSQFFLADLVAIIALAGLVFALPRSFGRNDPPVGIFVLIGLVVVVWRTFRVMRAHLLATNAGGNSIRHRRSPRLLSALNAVS